VEAETGFTDLMGNKYRFSEFLVLSFGEVPPCAPPSVRKPWEDIGERFTRYPEAIPLRNIKAPRIVEALVKFFTLVGLPSLIQSDQVSNFMPGVMQQVTHQLGIKQC